MYSSILYRFVLNTDTISANVKEFLQKLYLNIWVEYVVQNPLCSAGAPITSELFKTKLDEYIKHSTFYTIKS